jgi:RNA polymerase sigma-70 factor (ECF subfamily)
MKDETEMTDELEDRRLVKRLLAHDREAFNAFFDGYFPRLYRFARTRVGNDPETAKEVVQVTLTKAIRKLATYRGEAALFTWLCTICRNEIAEYRERVARDRRHVVLTEDAPDIARPSRPSRRPSPTTPSTTSAGSRRRD